MAKVIRSLAFALLMVQMPAFPAQAQSSGLRPSEAESFPIGTSGPACEAVGVSMGATRGSMYDRKWVILCSDAAQPVGTAYAFRDGNGAAGRAQAARDEVLDCGETGASAVDSAGTAEVATCRGRESGLDWKVYRSQADGAHYIVEGIAGYDSALRLALANLMADAVVPGEISIANLGAQDDLALVRAKAAVTNLDTLIGEGYRGNSAGSYAEAAELFATAPELLDPDDQADQFAKRHELMVNQALQLSNLGAFDQSARIFAQAREISGSDLVQVRLARNYEAIDAINRGDLAGALKILDRPVTQPVPRLPGEATALEIDAAIAASLNSGGDNRSLLGQDTHLTPQERAIIIDAQAGQLRGTVLRLQGQPDAARSALSAAYAKAMGVREGRVTSIARLRSQILSEMAMTYETDGRFGEAEALLRRALDLVETQYPDSTSVNVARARLAGFLARRGNAGEAMALYRGVVENIASNQKTLVGMENLMRPYFDLLIAEEAGGQSSFDALFLASQLVEQPGAADTLAQLSRQLEAGDDEASTLYRQSLVLNREIERTRIALARLSAPDAGDAAATEREALKQRQQRLLDAQLQLLDALSDYPAFRAVAHRYVTSDDMRASLKAGEGYLKLVQIAGSVYGLYLSPTTSSAWRVEMTGKELADHVALLRDSISVTVNGVQSTYPFEVDRAVELHDALLGPARQDIAAARHLVFEPDGAMLQLPINLLTGDRGGVEAYHARVEQGGDEYDFTGIDWLGRNTEVSTALSAASFRDARKAPSSAAGQAFLGLGQNEPLGTVSQAAYTRSIAPGSASLDCAWPVSAWNQPISAAELREASNIFGKARADLMIGANFTDAAIKARPDLANYRIVHFATHGLVTAPAVGCPVNPALLTSFGEAEQSDGLLTFKEIFDLQLDADLVVLSACDTAGQASMAATREAGVTTGGGQALDGLVRAFIAAGGRQVIASHWPAPDDFDATQRLFDRFYLDSNASIGDALRKAQHSLMDDPLTSHPFYWAGFAIVGDASRTVAVR